ncbi:MAG: cation:dicarboxylase symporter family transporter, partial [Pisciglobus halotolerans]|nr:cation:dicarboxylase symporter family transporter [Pisciglobus halotolerans]
MEIVLTLAIFIALLYFLYRMQKRYIKYSYRVFAGLGLGIIFGAVIQLLFSADSATTSQIIEWINIVGSGYVRFLQMLVMPLIFVSLVRAFTEMEGENNLGKIGFNVLSVLVITVMIASALGIATVLLFNLDGAEFTRGAAENAQILALQETQSQVADLTIPQQIVDFIPSNIFNDLAGLRGNSTIAVVIFSAMVGIAYLGVARKQPEHAKVFHSFINSLHAIVMRIVTLVLRMAPFGILALMTKMVATSSIASLANMGTFLVASYFAIIVMFLIHALILLAYQVNPLQYIKKAWNVLSFAFTSRSSAGALPLNISTQKEAMGIDRTTSNLAATFGLSIGQNGCAGIYPSMLVAIIAPAVGMDLSDPIVWGTIIVTVAISSFGVAGVGGGATFASLIVFGALDLPIEIIGLMISVEPVLDMARTALNVNDSMLAGVVTSKRLGTFDDEIMNDDNKIVSPEM